MKTKSKNIFSLTSLAAIVLTLSGCANFHKVSTENACFTDFDSLPAFAVQDSSFAQKLDGEWLYNYSNPNDPGYHYLEQCRFSKNGQFSCEFFERGCVPNGFCDGHQWAEQGSWSLDNGVLEMVSDKGNSVTVFEVLALTDEYIYLQSSIEKRLYYRPPICQLLDTQTDE